MHSEVQFQRVTNASNNQLIKKKKGERKKEGEEKLGFKGIYKEIIGGGGVISKEGGNWKGIERSTVGSGCGWGIHKIS